MRDFKELEKRRLKGATFLACGILQLENARELGAARQTVAIREQRLAEGSKKLLRRGDLGRSRRLDAERELVKVHMAGVLATGYPTELSTLPYAKVIARQSGVKYSTGHLWHLLRRLGLKPEKRAPQFNEPEIVRWKRYG